MNILQAMRKLLKKYVENPKSPDTFTMICIGNIDRDLLASAGFHIYNNEITITRKEAVKFLKLTEGDDARGFHRGARDKSATRPNRTNT